ncbi:MAG TPA: DNA topoisomerase IB [Casimicrobiaceae bacterium]|nr:DNA topoisomerase IB [Casimicrobiaceae bacterium]
MSEPRLPETPQLTAEIVDVLESAGLVYAIDAQPGIRRQGSPPDFSYVDAAGAKITDERTLERIAKLALPPAWADVWISRNPRAHLQATGRDAKGRKQYRYHAKWRDERDCNKFDRLERFARALPSLREAVERDLAKPGLSREKVIATMVSLLDRTCVRIGGERYRKENGSFGLTTLRDRHVEVQGQKIRIRFRGKSGKDHDITLEDRRIANVVRRCRDLPGYELFQYIDDKGEVSSVGAGDVNAYLKEVAGDDYTAKDFRTWGATVLAANAIVNARQPTSDRQTTRVINDAIRMAAATLGNTLAVCRRSYVHPGVLDYPLAARVAAKRHRTIERLSTEEARALALLVASAQPLSTKLEQSLKTHKRRRRGGRAARRREATQCETRTAERTSLR